MTAAGLKCRWFARWLRAGANSANILPVSRCLSIAFIAHFLTVVALAPPAARAEGSVGLEEVLKAVKDTPKLLTQIDVELRKRDLKAFEAVCIAARHGDHWKYLGGGRAAPYECQIGDRTVMIEADRSYFDVNGKRLGRLGEASDKVLFGRAKSFRETNFRWTWKP
jgi:hypothetical protein